MSNVGKLRFINFAHGLSILFTLFSTAFVIMGGHVTITDANGTVTELPGLAVWYQSIFLGFRPIHGFAAGMLLIVFTTLWYVAQYNKTSKLEIEAANKRVGTFVRQHWWKFLLIAVMLSRVTTEITVWYFELE